MNSIVPSIQMVDLKSQYFGIKSQIDEAIQHCIEQSAFIKGPQVLEFEHALSQYLKVKQVISCANGTDALQLAMMALGLERGDEVIVPAFTYVATAEVIGLLGLVPVMIDVEPHTFNLSVDELQKAISPKTKAIVPVHLFGQCADMHSIMRIAKENNLKVIEDNAQAIGAIYTDENGIKTAAGCIGDLGTTSFFPSKNLGCFGDGGAVMTHHPALSERVRMMANHGQRQKYIHDCIGINSRLDTLQAAILIEKLKYLDQYIAARQKAADFYDMELQLLDGVETPYRATNSTHVFHQYTIKVPAGVRDRLKSFLQKRGVPTMVYYPIPLPEQKAFQNIGKIVGDLSVTNDLCQRVLSLPMHTELPTEQLSYITESIKMFFKVSTIS